MNWIFIAQLIGVFAALVAICGGLFAAGRWIINKINAPSIAKFAALGLQLKEGIERIDSDVKQSQEDMRAFRVEMAAANARIDTLYQWFVDLLKEGRK